MRAVMGLDRLRRTAVILAAGLVLGAGLGACGSRENERGNPGQGPQSPGVDVGTNPAQSAQTSTTNTSTLGSSIIPAEKGKTTGAPVTKP
jgi:hypothetical protein